MSRRRHLKPDRRVVEKLYETKHDVGGDRAIGTRIKRSRLSQLISARRLLAKLRDEGEVLDALDILDLLDELIDEERGD